MSMVVRASSLLQRAYSGNTLYKNEEYRKTSSNHDKMSADRKALTRALDQLDTLDFESEDASDTKAIYETVTAYVNVYNNTIDTASESGSSDIRRSAKQMKALLKEHKDELKEIGISLKTDGTLKIDKTELKKATTVKVEKVFGNEDYKTELRKITLRMRGQINREPVSQQNTDSTAAQGTTVQSAETVGSNLNLYA